MATCLRLPAAAESGRPRVPQRFRLPAGNLLEGSCLIARGFPMGTEPFAQKKSETPFFANG